MWVTVHPRDAVEADHRSHLHRSELTSVDIDMPPGDFGAHSTETCTLSAAEATLTVDHLADDPFRLIADKPADQPCRVFGGPEAP